jgi:hypothetical protein
MGTNRIGGDWSAEALEAFRAAYGQSLVNPAEHDIDQNTGLPTEVISTGSPWAAHVGLWKYPSGKGPEEDLKKPFNVEDYMPENDDDAEEMTLEEARALLDELLDEEEDNELDEEVTNDLDEEDIISDEEIDALVEELLNSFDEEE